MNDMRKLMEAVKQLDEYHTAGFKNISVTMNPEDYRIDGKGITAAYIYAYDKSDVSIASRQKGFGWESEMSERDYADLINEIVPDINSYIHQAKNEKDYDWGDGDYRFDYIAFGADIGSDKELNERFINEVISKSLLSEMERLEGKTYFRGETAQLFKIDRPKKKNWLQKKFGRK